jgi:hypothetical protein
MTIGAIARRLRREESGVAMIIAVTLLAIMGTLMALILTVSTHTNFSTARGRSWTQALHVAEAGAQEAITRLQSSQGTYGGTFTGATVEGDYSVTVTHLSRKRYQIDARGNVLAGTAGLGASRRLRIIMAPPRSFLYALYSESSVETKGNDTIDGDIWANQSVTVEQGNTVTGSVTAATGYVYLKGGSHITGNVWSGGFNPDGGEAIHLDGNAIVDGTGKASVTAPTDPVTCGGENTSNYKVRLDSGASIAGNVVTWGTKTGAGTVGPPGTLTSNVCTASPATKEMPSYAYSPDNYDSTTLHEFGTIETPSATAVDDFQSYLSAHINDFSGTFFVNQSGAVNQDVRLELKNVVITADTTIVSNTPVFTDAVSDSTQDAIVTLVSTYQPPTGSSCDVNQDKSECSVHLKNNFQTSGDTAVLVYAPYGAVAVKNNQVQFGTIYANNIQIKNNQALTYDSRVERVVGFGPVTYEVESWIELAP